MCGYRNSTIVLHVTIDLSLKGRVVGLQCQQPVMPTIEEGTGDWQSSGRGRPVAMQQPAQYMSQQTPQGMPQQTPQGISQQISQSMPQQMWQGMSQHMSQGIPQQTPQGMPQQTPQGIPQQTPQGMPQQTPQGISQQTSRGMPQQTPQGIPHMTSEWITSTQERMTPYPHDGGGGIQQVSWGTPHMSSQASYIQENPGDPALCIPQVETLHLYETLISINTSSPLLLIHSLSTTKRATPY